MQKILNLFWPDVKSMWLVSRYTFGEIYKSKILINIVLIGFAQVIISYVASEFTFGVPQRVALDFGLGTLSLAAVGIAIFMGVNLISTDVENRTIYMVLARPINRYAFLCGRIGGMMGILVVNILILGIFTLLLCKFMGGTISSLMLWCLVFAFCEATLVLILVVLLSLVSNAAITVITSLALYVGGHAVSEVMAIPGVFTNSFLKGIITVYSFIFPDFGRLNLKQHVLYEQVVPSSYFSHGLLYAAIYGIVLVLIASWIFQRKNLD